MMTDKIAILIVNGGKDPHQGKWIQLCIDKILEHTEWQNYHIYVWNNNVKDLVVLDFLKNLPIITLVQANPSEKLAHFHRVPLQRLYESACKDKTKYIVTMDSDAHPIKKGWLKTLISSLNNEVVLAGVWRDELKRKIQPYIHPSCLCTTVDFIENNNLRLDYLGFNTENKVHDTLSSFTDKVNELGLDTFKLIRSNQRNFHRIMGGIYGGYIYHHGAGSRSRFKFWDEPQVEEILETNGKISQTITDLLFRKYNDYMRWLEGEDFDARLDVTIQKLSILSKKTEEIALGPPSKNHKPQPHKSSTLPGYFKAKKIVHKVISKINPYMTI